MKKHHWTKHLLLLAGVVLVCVSLFKITSPTSAFLPTATAQCGEDSYVDCAGGVRCVSIDDRYCKCFNSRGGIVSYHSCSEASPRQIPVKP
jgi:hypothetical protein